MSAAIETALAAVGGALNKWHFLMDQHNISRDYEAWQRARMRADAALRANLAFAGGTMVEGSEAKIRLCGIVATSTQGLQMAARNWVVAASKRVEQGGAS